MNKYIDAEKLIAEIERQNVDKKVIEPLIRIITSLQQEQSEVDLEKEYTEFVVSDPVYSKLVNGIVGKSIARHFYELGLNARKEK